MNNYTNEVVISIKISMGSIIRDSLGHSLTKLLKLEYIKEISNICIAIQIKNKTVLALLL